MEELFKEFELNESTNYDIKERNGMQLPSDYLEFDYNNDYEISKHIPKCIG